jgi:hypothetical protein
MRLKALQSALCLVLSPLLVAQSPEIGATSPGTANQSISIPKGTAVNVVTLETVSSATAKRGQRVRMAVNQEVSVDGIIVIPAGTPVVGEVTHVRRAIPNKKDGYVVIRPVYLNLASGARLNLREYPPGEDSCGDMGPCWEFFLIVVPLLAPVAAVGLTAGLIDAALHPRRKGPRVSGDDEFTYACWRDTGYTAAIARIPKIQSNPSAYRDPTFESCVARTR